MEPTTATLPGAALALIHTGEAPTRSALTAQARRHPRHHRRHHRRAARSAAHRGGGGAGRRPPRPPLAPAAARPGRPGRAGGRDPHRRLRGGARRPRRGDRGQGQPRPARVGRPRAGPRPGQRGGRGVAAPVGPLAASAPPSRVPFAVTEPGGAAVGALYFGWPDGAKVSDIFAAQLAEHGVTGPNGDAAGLPGGQRRQRGRAGRAPARGRPRRRPPAGGGGHPPRRRVRAGAAGRALHRQHRPGHGGGPRQHRPARSPVPLRQPGLPQRGDRRRAVPRRGRAAFPTRARRRSTPRSPC